MREKLKPKLRFNNFENPWNQSLLMDQVEIRRGLTYKPNDVRSSGVRVLRSSNIVDDTFILSDNDVFVDKAVVNIPRISNGDILVTAANGSTKLVGKHAIVENLVDNEIVVHGGFMLLFKTEQNYFVNAWMSSNEYKRVLQFVQGGNGAIGNLSSTVLKSMKMSFPSLQEQTAIGSLLRTLDELIASHKENLTNYQYLKTTMLSKMFPKAEQTVPDIRLDGFDGEWEKVKLKDVTESIEYGLNASAKEFDGENKYIRITDIDDVSRKFKEDSLTSPDIDVSECDNYLLCERDILFARTGASVGKTYLYDKKDGKVYFAGFLIRARIKEKFDSKFIFQNTLTDRFIQYVKVTSQRSGQPGVNGKEYGEYELYLPKYEEQQFIGSYFSNLDNCINSFQEKISQLETLKKKLLQDMFI